MNRLHASAPTGKGEVGRPSPEQGRDALGAAGRSDNRVNPGSVSKIPERKLPEKRRRAVQAKRGACRCIVTIPWGVSRGSPAPAYRMLRGQKPSCRGCSSARNGGKVSDATFAAGSDLNSVSIRARRPSECCCARAPGEARTLSRRTRLRVSRPAGFSGLTARRPGGDCAPFRPTICASRCDAPPPSLRSARAGRLSPRGVRLAISKCSVGPDGLLKVLRSKLQMPAHLLVHSSRSFVCASSCRGSTWS